MRPLSFKEAGILNKSSSFWSKLQKVERFPKIETGFSASASLFARTFS